jgi:nicotinamide-nucleotide amidase
MDVDRELAARVGQALRERDLKLVTAESCTGGQIGDWITDVPGSSDYYLGGVVAYSYEAKMRLLGVPAGLLAQYGAVSRETVLAMVQGARAMLADDFPLQQTVAVSVSGIAGPGGGMPGKPVGLVWIGLEGPGFTGAYRFVWPGNRSENKRASAGEALRLLLEYLHSAPRAAMP